MNEDDIFTATYLTVQLLALLLAIISFKKYKNTTEKVFLYFLIYAVVITEVTAYAFRQNGLQSSFIFNVFSLVSISFYHYWFHNIIEKHKKYIIFSWLIFLVSFISMFIYGDFINDVWYQPVMIGSVAVFIFSVLFFVQLLQQDTEVNIYGSQKFWIVTGLLIFNLGIAPVLYFLNNMDTLGIQYNLIVIFLNIILYGCYIISFLCLYKK